MSSKRGHGQGQGQGHDAARTSKSDRPPRQRITKLGSFQDDSDEILMQAASRTARNSLQDISEQESKRRTSIDKKRPSGRLTEIAELRGPYKNLPNSSPSPSPSLQRSAATVDPAHAAPSVSRQQERPSLESTLSTKQKSSQAQKWSSVAAGRSARGQTTAPDVTAGYASTFAKRQQETNTSQSEAEAPAARTNEERKQERSWVGPGSGPWLGPGPLASARALPLPLPPRSFYAPAQTSQAIERMLKRSRVAGPNLLFPMYPGRPLIAAGRGTRVELHVHLEGAVRHATIWEFMKRKKMTLPGDGSVRAIREAIVLTEPVPPTMFFEPVPIYLQCFVGDLNALERIAYEFCEDKVREGVLYVEVRYSPRMLLGKKIPLPRGRAIQDLAEVVMAINRGFRVGEREFGIVVRTILCLIAGRDGFSDILSLVQQFQDDGVVGIDLHMPYENSQKEPALPGLQSEEVPLSREVVKAFMQASHLGISRTVHAGLLGSAYMVQRGIEKYRAQRIGHGYEVLKLPQLYVKSKERDVHFECCPWMSLLASSVDPAEPKHPIAQFAEDGMNFSLNTSHPTLTGLTLQEEYDLVSSWGFSEVHLVRANINALRSSFLQASEKSNLMQTLLENLGIKHRSFRK